VSFADLCVAIYYAAAFQMTWIEVLGRKDTMRVRTRWLRRHMIDRGRVARAA
jgi:hypothetical protein